MTGNDLHVSTQAIYFPRWPADGLGRGAAQRRLDRASTIAVSSDRTFHVLVVRHMMHMRIPSTGAVLGLQIKPAVNCKY